MLNLPTAVLAQQSQFVSFAGLYCCFIPLGFMLALGLVYFGIRWWVKRNDRR